MSGSSASRTLIRALTDGTTPSIERSSAVCEPASSGGSRLQKISKRSFASWAVAGLGCSSKSFSDSVKRSNSISVCARNQSEIRLSFSTISRC